MNHLEWTELHFDRVSPWLQAALDREPVQTHTLEHVRAELDSGKCQIWPTANSVTITEIIEYPTGAKVMHHWLAGGDLDEIVRTNANLEAFAREQGCIGIEVKARRGWLQVMRDNGFRPAGTHFWKDLVHG
jgi:hypothetical protein